MKLVPLSAPPAPIEVGAIWCQELAPDKLGWARQFIAAAREGVKKN